MEGLDDISLTLTQEDAIRAYEEARPAFKPRTLPAKHLAGPGGRLARARTCPGPEQDRKARSRRAEELLLRISSVLARSAIVLIGAFCESKAT